MGILTEQEQSELLDLQDRADRDGINDVQKARFDELDRRASAPDIVAPSAAPAAPVVAPSPSLDKALNSAFPLNTPDRAPLPLTMPEVQSVGMSAPEAEQRKAAAALAGAMGFNPVTEVVGTAREGWNLLKKKVIDPAVFEPAQAAGRIIFEPGLETIGEMGAPGVEYGARSLGTLTMGEFGEGKPNNMGPRELAGVNQFEQGVGLAMETAAQMPLPQEVKSIGSAALQSLMVKAPELPIMLIPGGQGGAVAQGVKAGFLGELAMPGGDPIVGALAGGTLGKAFDVGGKYIAEKLAKKTAPVVEGLVLPSDVQAFGDTLAKAEPGPRTGAPVTDVVVPGPDGTPILKSVEMTAEGPRVVEEAPAGFKTSPGRPRNAPIVTDAAAETLTDAQLNSLRDLSADETRRAVKALKAGGRLKPEEQLTIFTAENRPEWQAIDTPYTADKYEDGALVVSDNGALRVQDINDPALKRESLKARTLVEVTLPDGEKAFGFLGTADHVYQPRIDPTTGQPVIDADSGEVVRDAVKTGKLIITAPDPAEGLDSALADWALFDPKNVRLVTKDTELDDVIRYAQGYRSTKPDAPGNKVPPGGLPPEPPPPPIDGNPPDGTPPGPPPPPATIDPNLDVGMTWWKKLGSAAKTFQNKMVGSHSRGPITLQQWAQTQYALAAGNYDKTFTEAFKNMSKQFGVDKLPTADQARFATALTDVFQGRKTAEAMSAEWPQFAQKQRQLIEALGAARDADHLRLLEAGGVMPAETLQPGQTIDDLIPYATRPYLRWMLPPGEYAKLARQDAAKMAKWRKYVYDTYINAPDSPTRLESDAVKAEQTDILLDDMLGKNDARDAKLAAKGKAGSSSLDWTKSLRERNEKLPEMMREIFGETDHGLYKIALTRARQRAAVANAEMWKMVHERPDYWSDLPKRDLNGEDYIRLPNDRSRYASMANKYITPEAYEALVTAPEASKAATDWVANLSRFVKTNQVLAGGLGPWKNNVIGNFSGLAMAGGVNPFTATFEMASMARDFHQYKLQAGAETSVPAQRISRARELNVLGGGNAKGEMSAQTREVEKLLAAAVTKDGRPVKRSFANFMLDAAKAPKAAYLKGVDVAGRAFDAIDQTAKYISWTGLLKKGGIHPKTGEIDSKLAKKFLGAQYVETTKARLKALVEREAARRVHMSFPMMNATGAWVRKMQDKSGVLAPYIGIRAEIMRTYLLAAKRMAEGEPGMRARMLAYSTAALAMGMAYKEMRASNGISQEQVDEAYANLPDATKRYHPGMTALWWRDAEGRVQFWDTGQALLEPLQYLQGDDSRAIWSRVLGNTLQAPFEGGAFDVATQRFLEYNGLADEPYSPDVAEWKKTGWRALDDLWKAGAGPTIVPRTLDRLQEAGVIGARNPRSLTPAPDPTQSVANTLFGPTIFPAPPNPGMGPVYEMRDARKDLKQSITGPVPGRIEGPLQGASDRLQGLFGVSPTKQRQQDMADRLKNKGKK